MAAMAAEMNPQVQQWVQGMSGQQLQQLLQQSATVSAESVQPYIVRRAAAPPSTSSPQSSEASFMSAESDTAVPVEKAQESEAAMAEVTTPEVCNMNLCVERIILWSTKEAMVWCSLV